MQINFKGLYVIPGTFDKGKGSGQTMDDISIRKMKFFLETTKPYRTTNDMSFYNTNTGDYFISVDDNKERTFEDEVDTFGIECNKIQDIICINGKNNEAEQLNNAILFQKPITECMEKDC